MDASGLTYAQSRDCVPATSPLTLSPSTLASATPGPKSSKWILSIIQLLILIKTNIAGVLLLFLEITAK